MLLIGMCYVIVAFTGHTQFYFCVNVFWLDWVGVQVDLAFAYQKRLIFASFLTLGKVKHTLAFNITFIILQTSWSDSWSDW